MTIATNGEYRHVRFHGGPFDALDYWWWFPRRKVKKEIKFDLWLREGHRDGIIGFLRGSRNSFPTLKKSEVYMLKECNDEDPILHYGISTVVCK